MKISVKLYKITYKSSGESIFYKILYFLYLIGYIVVQGNMKGDFYMAKSNVKVYHPLYFLAALGNGGLAVSFFMYFMFLIPHPDTPIPNFSHISKTFQSGGLQAVLTVIVSVIIILLAVNHFRLLIWNVQQIRAFKASEAYAKLKVTPGGVTMMVEPLTYAMSINVIFILGALFVPGLWNVVGYLFPFAMLGFLAIGVFAIKVYVDYLKQFFVGGQFNFEAINHYGQMLGAFAFIMVAVGLASPAAMSKTLFISATSAISSFVFVVFAIAVVMLFFGASTRAILKNGLAKANAPTIWMAIPIFTLTGITFIRLYSMIAHNVLGTQVNPAIAFAVLGVLFAASIVVGIIGYVILKKLNYFNEQPDPSSSFGLICPGVALFVLGMFFINWGLVKTEIIAAYSVLHFVIIAVLAISQLKTVQWLTRLTKQYL